MLISIFLIININIPVVDFFPEKLKLQKKKKKNLKKIKKKIEKKNKKKKKKHCFLFNINIQHSTFFF